MWNAGAVGGVLAYVLSELSRPPQIRNTSGAVDGGGKARLTRELIDMIVEWQYKLWISSATAATLLTPRAPAAVFADARAPTLCTRMALAAMSADTSTSTLFTRRTYALVDAYPDSSTLFTL